MLGITVHSIIVVSIREFLIMVIVLYFLVMLTQSVFHYKVIRCPKTCNHIFYFGVFWGSFKAYLKPLTTIGTNLHKAHNYDSLDWCEEAIFASVFHTIFYLILQ